jgi:hypothetical protein
MGKQVSAICSSTFYALMVTHSELYFPVTDITYSKVGRVLNVAIRDCSNRQAQLAFVFAATLV